VNGYWNNDPTNYEQIDITILYKWKFLKTYFGTGYVVSPDASRKRHSMQLGIFTENIPKEKLDFLVLGFDIRMLQNNDYYPNLKCGLGARFFNEKPFYLMMEYYLGHLPYSRFESEVFTTWYGLGLYIGSLK